MSPAAAQTTPHREKSFTIAAVGKSKAVMRSDIEKDLCQLLQLDGLSAGNGARTANIDGKSILSATTNCNSFELLQRAGVPTAYLGRHQDPRMFRALYTDMIKLEVVVRRMAGPRSSFAKRNPLRDHEKPFPEPIVEFFLKTKDKQWMHHKLPCDDPLLLSVGEKSWGVYQPDIPVDQQSKLFTIGFKALDLDPEDVKFITETAKVGFRVMETGWGELGARLEDIKFEFGRTRDGEILLSDEVCNDNWRLYYDGRYICKQPFRDGADLRLVLENYQLVAELSKKFNQVG